MAPGDVTGPDEMTFTDALELRQRGRFDALDRLLDQVARTYQITSDDVLQVLHGMWERTVGETATVEEWLRRARAWVQHPAAVAEYYGHLGYRRRHAREAHTRGTTLLEARRHDEESAHLLWSREHRGSGHAPGDPESPTLLLGLLLRIVCASVGLAERRPDVQCFIASACGHLDGVAERLGVQRAAAERLANEGWREASTRVNGRVLVVLLRALGAETGEIAAKLRVTEANVRMKETRGRRDLQRMVAQALEA